MQIEKIGEIEIFNSDGNKILFDLKIDLTNKLLYFFESNEMNEPVLCLSLDVLSSTEISKVKINSINN